MSFQETMAKTARLFTRHEHKITHLDYLDY